MHRIFFLGVAGIALFALGFARFSTFHNQTFDLAFYSRMAWGMVRFDFWDPFMNAPIAGLHVSPVLFPIGALGSIFGTSTTLLAAQALGCVCAGATLGKMGERHLGPVGWWIGAFAVLVHPNLAHVATYEAHPGTLAIFPLALAIERLDAGSKQGFVWACIGVLACREDLALVTALLGVLAFRSSGAWRTLGLRVALASIAYFLLFALVLHPLFAPDNGSFEAHFGGWGESMGEALGTWLTSPLRVVEHLLEPQRLGYLPLMLAPLLFAPLLGARWLVPAIPILAINLLSFFPTTTNIDSHYFTPALPFFAAATIRGTSRLIARRRIALRWLVIGLGGALGLSAMLLGINPSSDAYTPSVLSAPSQRIVEAIAAQERELGHTASLQAPDPLLAHLAERARIHRGPPPDANTDLVVLDLRHRERFRFREDLLRTTQEPDVRTWLARTDYGVAAFEPPWLLMRRGMDPRARLGELETSTAQHVAQRLCECLSIAEAREGNEGLELVIVAHRACPNDLALRVDNRVDLLFEGAISPAHLQQGDTVVSRHPPRTSTGPLHLGAIRSSGAPPNPNDPVHIEVQINPGER